MINRLQNINWGKLFKNLLRFSAPNLITAILATQTNVFPLLIKNPGYLALVIIIENFVIDLIRKYQDTK